MWDQSPSGQFTFCEFTQRVASPAEKAKKFGSNSIFGRPAQPVEQAAVFVFLASDDASYVSGEIFGATGGRMPL